MKCVVVIASGLADDPCEGLGGKTPLDAARTPHLDAMAARGILGLTRTVPGTGPVGDAAGMLAVLGYDAAHQPPGTAAFEARGLGIDLAPGEVAFRASLVTLDATEDGTEMLGDPLGGRLAAGEADQVARDLAASLGTSDFELVPGVGHRHVVVWRRGAADVVTASPYELVDRPGAGALPTGPGGEAVVAFMQRTRALLREHPICRERRERAERVPTTLWLWEPAGAVTIPPLHDTFGVDGILVGATPLARGLGAAAGLRVVRPRGATGDGDTDLGSKVDATLDAIGEGEFVVVHVAMADVAAHGGDGPRKVAAIERIDAQLVGPLLEGLRQRAPDWRLLVVSDHATSVTTRRHTAEPVPFVVATARDDAKSTAQKRGCAERDAREQGIFIPDGHTLLERMLRP